MEKKGLILMAMVIWVICALASLAEARVFNWTKEGVSPFWYQPVQTVEELKALFKNEAFKNKLAASIGTEAAKAAENAVMSNQAVKTAYPMGTEFDWMFYGPGPTPKKIDAETVRWGGSYDLVGFRIPIGNETIFLGSKCVNILKPKIIKSEIPGEYFERTTSPQPQVVEKPPVVVVVEKPVYIERPVYIYEPVYEPAPYRYSRPYSYWPVTFNFNYLRGRGGRHYKSSYSSPYSSPYCYTGAPAQR